MNTSNDFQNFHFERHFGKIPRRVLSLIGVPIGFTILWIALPAAAVYWLTLLLIAGLTYVSGFGWEQALAHLIHFLQGHQRL
jgi:hypothetical protein